MPIHEIHKKKKIKNYTLLAILVAFILTFFFVTIVKFQDNAANVQSERKE